ncbi:hypothetical protein ACSEXT_10965 [Lactiplantibacillus plantarum]|nr:hypothetical protein [Lactiplantibacillus plantarum]MCG5037384.1 hypothetical protein [Lactiplantibacillus plantarum]
MRPLQVIQISDLHLTPTAKYRYMVSSTIPGASLPILLMIFGDYQPCQI